jgi:transcription factor IIIB 90 kDa subunit
MISTLKHDPEGIISLSDVDDEEIDAMILNEEESRLKKVIWNNLNRDWIKMQKQKKILKKAIEKKGGGAGATLGIRTNKERKIK